MNPSRSAIDMGISGKFPKGAYSSGNAQKSRSFSELSAHFSPGDKGLQVKCRSSQVVVVARRCSRVHPWVADHGLVVGPNFHAERRTDLDRPLQKLEQLEQAIEETIAEAIPPKSRWRVAGRIVGWMLLVAYFLFAAALLALRYWILPKVAEYRSDAERYASKVLGSRITIGAMEAGWRGPRPELLLANGTVCEHDGCAARSRPAAEATRALTP